MVAQGAEAQSSSQGIPGSRPLRGKHSFVRWWAAAASGGQGSWWGVPGAAVCRWDAFHCAVMVLGNDEMVLGNDDERIAVWTELSMD